MIIETSYPMISFSMVDVISFCQSHHTAGYDISIIIAL